MTLRTPGGGTNVASPGAESAATPGRSGSAVSTVPVHQLHHFALGDRVARCNPSAVQEAQQAQVVVASGVVDAVFSAIADALTRDESVTIPGFGTFTTKTRGARQGRNPRTGESIAIAASRSPSFKAGQTLRDTVRG